MTMWCSTFYYLKVIWLVFLLLLQTRGTRDQLFKATALWEPSLGELVFSNQRNWSLRDQSRTWWGETSHGEAEGEVLLTQSCWKIPFRGYLQQLRFLRRYTCAEGLTLLSRDLW